MEPQIRRNYVRSTSIPPVALSSTDLIKLYDILKEKVNEAKELQISSLQQIEDLPREQLEETKERIEKNLDLTVIVNGSKGEILADNTNRPFLPENLPDEVTKVTFENSFLFRLFFNYDPNNRIEIRLNFERQKLFDFSNPSLKLEPLSSFYKITGDNETWVNGVFESLQSFFKTKRLNRGIIHKKHIYDLLLWLSVLPIVFYTLFRFDMKLDSLNFLIPNVLAVGIYIYITLILLFLFRFLFNYLRWLFPIVEHTDSRRTRNKVHRTILVLIIIGILTTLITDVIKTLF